MIPQLLLSISVCECNCVPFAGKFENIIYTQAVAIDEDVDTDMHTFMAEEAQFLNSNPEGSLQYIFWDEQKKAGAKRKGHGVCWHLLMIKFCLYLRHQSGKAYETLGVRLHQASYFMGLFPCSEG